MAMTDQGKRSPRKERLAVSPGRPSIGTPGSALHHAAHGGNVPVYDAEGRPLNRAARRAGKRGKR